MTVDLVQMKTSTVECNWDVNSQVQSTVFSLDVKILNGIKLLCTVYC